MANDVVLTDEISQGWVRELHVVSMEQAPSWDKWTAQTPSTCLDTLRIHQYKEDPLGVYHLRMWWNIREVVELKLKEDKRRAVAWWIGKGTSFRQAAIDAATRHYIEMDKDAEQLVTRSVPEAAPRDADGQPLPLELDVLGKTIMLKLAVADWVPRGYLVVMEGK